MGTRPSQATNGTVNQLAFDDAGRLTQDGPEPGNQLSLESDSKATTMAAVNTTTGLGQRATGVKNEVNRSMTFNQTIEAELSGERNNDILISFCTTCMNRLKHLSQTLPVNLHDNRDIPSVEFIVLDYNSSDGLKDWMENEMGNHLATKRLLYRTAKGFQYFHMAHAKNIAHRLARGKIVCNLDADNFTGDKFAEYLMNVFSNGKRLIVRAPRITNETRGTLGRIAMRKTDFELIGGYDEQMKFGWGHEDRDLINRARMIGFRLHYMPSDSPFLKLIQHDQSDRTRYNRVQNHVRSSALHRQISMGNIKRGEFIANRGKQWGSLDDNEFLNEL